MEAPKELHGLARNGLREISERELKARGPRKNGGLLSGWARRLFRGRSLQRDPGDHLRDRHAGAAWGWTSTTQGRHDVLRALPGMDIGVDLGEEWEMAERLMDLQ